MKPIYFPFTYISRQTMAAIRACLGSFVVYQPSERDVPEAMRPWAANDLIELRVPAPDDGDRLASALKEYSRWARLHQGKYGIDLGYLSRHRDRLPFFDDTASSQIRADLKGRLKDEFVPAEKAPDRLERLFEAKIYLSIAQQLDLQSDSVQKDLQRVDEMEAALMRKLKGDDDVAGGGRVESADRERRQEYMLSERLEAWTRLLANDTAHAETGDSGLFVTGSRAALEQAVDTEPRVIELIRIDDIPVVDPADTHDTAWQCSVVEKLASLVVAGQRGLEDDGLDLPAIPGTGSAGEMASLSVYMVPGKRPVEVFTSSAGRLSSGGDKSQQSENIKNTIVCAVDCPSN